MFFYNGKKFCLRGGEEHRSLKISQFKWFEDAYVYTENGSKNHSEGLALLWVENKVLPSYAIPEADTRCHAKLMDLYLSKIPPEAKIKVIFVQLPRNQLILWLHCTLLYHTGRRCLGRWCKICASGRYFQKDKQLFVCHGSDRNVSIRGSWEGYTIVYHWITRVVR